MKTVTVLFFLHKTRRRYKHIDVLRGNSGTITEFTTTNLNQLIKSKTD